jgi:hypothetical protein
MFWTPAFAGVTLQETFYEIININKAIIIRTSIFFFDPPGFRLAPE